MTQLAYQVPDNGRAKTILRIPESHTLYLCPNSCGRRQGIRALKNGEADHVSFLSLSQADVALGAYVDLVAEAVDAVLDAVSPRPRVLTVYVNCIDDFLGTDTESLLADLSARHPSVRFMLGRINPIAADVAASTASGVQMGLYAPLEPAGPGLRDRGVNAVGGFVAAAQGMPELVETLAALGAGPVRDLVSCPDYDAYARMARSCLNLSVSLLGDGPCAAMEERLGIPWLSWHACYDLDEIARRYAALGEKVTPPGAGRGDAAGEGARALLDAARGRAQAAVERARRTLGSTPLVVDTSASLMPFSLARALLGYGFNVAAVFALHSKDNDAQAERALQDEHPEVAIARKQGLEAFGAFPIGRPCLAVGRDAGFLLRAEHVADVYHDEGFFGYAGVERLMGALEAALAVPAVWEA